MDDPDRIAFIIGLAGICWRCRILFFVAVDILLEAP